MQKIQCSPTGIEEIRLSSEEIRAKFPSLYDFEIWRSSSIETINGQLKARYDLLFGGLPSTLNSAF